MPKQLKKIKVKKPKKPRQPRRAGVPRKPPVTNISVNISGGSGQPTGSYYFPDAQQVQPLVNNIFTNFRTILECLSNRIFVCLEFSKYFKFLNQS